jgi:sugar lactone lactonase YvrE
MAIRILSKIFILAAVVLGSSCLIGCSVPFAAVDCAWNATAQTWVDMNGNGIRDSGDPPLPGVLFHVDDILNGYSGVGSGDGPTDWKGEAQLYVWLPGCPKARFEIYPDVPSGYRALSDSKPTVDARSTGRVFDFGFSQLAGFATITPRPAPPSCTSYHLGMANRYDITDIDIAANGTVWVATFNDGLRSLAPGSSEWVYVDVRDGLVNNQVRSITPLTDGSVWFGTEGGASHLDSNGWTSFTKAQGLIDNNVYGIAKAPNGDIWFATAGGVSHLDAKTSTWNSIVVSDDIIHAVAVSSSGTPWITSLFGNPSRVIANDTGGYILGLGFNFDFGEQLTFGRDGALWVAGYDGVGKYDPGTGTLVVYNESSTKGAFVNSANGLAIASDGSIWIATTAYTPTICHFLPWLDAETASAWEFFDGRDGIPTLPKSATNDDSVKAIAVTPTGDIWVATTEHATRCRFGGQ